MDILDDMGVSKLSAKVFLKVNYSFNAGLTSRLIATFLYKVTFPWLFFSHSANICLVH